MPGNENMTLAELIRAGLALGSGQERRFTATLDGGEVYDVRLYAQARPGTAGGRGVGVNEDRGVGVNEDREAEPGNGRGGTEPGTRKTLGVELTRR